MARFANPGDRYDICLFPDGWMLADCNERLKCLARYCSPSGPKCCMWSIVRPPRPDAVEFLDSLMAAPKVLAVKKQMFWSKE